MLVLSRRVDETIEVPDVGISVQVLGIVGNRVRIGIRAPENIGILRGELAPEDVHRLDARRTTRVLSREEFHELKNQLHAIGLSLHLLERQREAGRDADAERTLNRLLEQGDAIRQSVVVQQPPVRLSALLVEDDSNERELLAGSLRMSGFDVETACDGLEALERLQAEDVPDVVLLDLRMPRCDGPTALNSIRNNPRTAKLRVFAVSATSPDEMGVSTGAGGIDGWFPKPLNPEVLARQIQRMVHTTGSI